MEEYMRRIVVVAVVGLALGLTLGTTAAMAQVAGPLVMTPEAVAVSPTLHSIARLGTVTMYGAEEFGVRRGHEIDKVQTVGRALGPQASVSAAPSTPYNQTATTQPLGAIYGPSFEGLGKGTPGYSVGVTPPDTTLGVSPTQVVQWVNLHLAVYDKVGNPLLPAPGFIPGNAIWSAFPPGSLCRDTNRGDPMVQYDRMAGRWILTQFAFNSGATQNAQCVAVSTTNNALGSYYLYEYGFGTQLPDYPKLGVWPDAYYITFNMFNLGSSFTGGQACAFDRAGMLVGAASPQAICFRSSSRFSYLPSDLDGTLPPPPGTPNYHISWDWPFLAGPPYTMQLTKFKPNFVTPALSTFDDGFGGATFSYVAFPLDAGTIAACNDNGNNCVPQPGTANRLDTLGSRHMYRLVYRNFGNTGDALLVTQAVDAVPGGTQADLRWWHIRFPGWNPPVVHQNSNFIPDSQSRWMGSAAFDRFGNIGIGYSLSSSATFPSIAVGGREQRDPRHLLRAESVRIAGTGSDTGPYSRWGDYSAMQIDPKDDCTFWYTTQYLASSAGSFNWRTRVVSFKFPNNVCGR
jgi:hypothetical protein